MDTSGDRDRVELVTIPVATVTRVDKSGNGSKVGLQTNLMLHYNADSRKDYVNSQRFMETPC